MLTNDLSVCDVGFAQYTLLCNENGGVIDDLIVYRLAKMNFYFVNASNVETDFYTLKKNSEYDCTILIFRTILVCLPYKGLAPLVYRQIY